MEQFEWFTLARVIHVLAVVVWIGGVSMVTTVILPSVKRMVSEQERVKVFEQLEGRFATQAKIATLLTGISGFYMLYELDAWGRYMDYRFWWIHAMTIVWFVFSLILFVLEPLVLHRVFRKYAELNSEKTFRIIHRAHWVLLVLSLLTVFGAVAGSHGWFFLQ